MMKITGLSHLFKWENLHNWWLTKYFFAPLYVCVLCIFIMCIYKYIHIQYIFGKYLHVYTFMYSYSYILYYVKMFNI